MRLEKLELQGFKSFAAKTEVYFSDGVTAIIGPNGSGKSNISDAVRWVLGEQSARLLRGNKMDDVIFNGTAAKRPLSMCSVTMTFDNKDRKLSQDNDTVEITRRVYRSGASEYCINNKGCRLKDIYDLFRDTGIGKDGYSIISQGRVDEILSNRSDERRIAFEEAAGVSGYRAKREEALRKLALADKNAERLSDIQQELQQRLIPLAEESRKAKEANELQSRLKILEVAYFLRENSRCTEKIAAQSAIVLACSETIEQNEKEDALLQEKILKAETEENAAELNAKRLRETQLEVVTAFEKKQSEIQLLSERSQHISEELRRLDGDRTNAEKKAAAYDGVPDSEEGHLSIELETLRNAVSKEELALSALLVQTGEAEETLEKKKTALMERMNRLAEARSGQSGLLSTETALRKRCMEIEAELVKEKSQELALQKEQTYTKDFLIKAKGEKCKAEKALRELRACSAETEEKRKAVSEQLRIQEQKLAAKESRLHLLKEVAKRHEGYQNSVRLLLEDSRKDIFLQQAVIGVLAEMISVPEKLQAAVSALLGAAQQDIISYTGEDAKRIIEHVRRKQYGRVTVLPLDLLRVSRNRIHAGFLKKPGILGIASELITFDASVEKAVEYLLGGSLIAEDMDSALRLRREENCFFPIATLSGDILQSGCAMSGGSVNSRNIMLLSREQEIRSLESEIGGLNKTASGLKEQLNALEKKSSGFAAAYNEKQADLQRKLPDMEHWKEKLSIIEHDIQSNVERQAVLKEEISLNGEELQRIREKIQVLSSESENLQNTDEAARQEIISGQKALLQLRTALEEKRNSVSEQKLHLAAVEKDLTQQQKEKQRQQAERKEWQQQLSEINLAEEKRRKDSSSLVSCIEKLKTELAAAHERVTAVQQEKEKAEVALQDIKDTLTALRWKREQLMQDNGSLLNRKTKADLALAKIKAQQEQLADTIWQRYELTKENAAAMDCKAVPPGDLRPQITQIRDRLRTIGPVNPGSIAELEEVNERNETLSAQLEDIRKAGNDLKQLIEKLTHTMEQDFRQGLEKIRTQFTDVYTTLFGGGHAELVLKEPGDVLNSDIDIIAQPPGKKLQLLSLMSGGERALTAIALLFAMLRIKSPAFCVLDEIDTSLDEENVARFASFLKQYGTDTQFIVITHRKGSMEAANSIFGVTMEEKGISTVISAKWEETS